MKKKPIDWLAAGAAWKAVEDHLGPVCFAQTAANFARNQALMDELVAVTASTDAPAALFNLLDCLSDWVEAYEQTHSPFDEASPAEVLKHLMEANGLRQVDLAGELGGQSTVSAVLAGNRPINAGQASRLARRFGVSAAVFIARAEESEEPKKRFSGRFETADESQVATGALTATGWQEECVDGAPH